MILKKNSVLKGMLYCASISLIATSVGASETSDSSVKLFTGDLNNNELATSSNKSLTSTPRNLKALLGTDYNKFRPANSGKPIPNQYIVVYKDQSVEKMANSIAGGDVRTMTPQLAKNYRAEAIDQMTSSVTSKFDMTVSYRYGHAVGGFAAKINDKTLKTFIKDSRVDFIEQDQIMNTIAIQNNATWGLDRIDETSLPLDGVYEFNFDGTGVDAYVIDTGIRSSHIDFNGRVRGGATAIEDGNGANDCNGHGTHVAGTIGSQTFGVAKNVTLIPVRVFGCSGGASNSGVIAGVNYVARVASGPSVANMSLGGGASAALDSAVTNAVREGITFVVAAGNSNVNACSTSPARVSTALTAGATTISDVRSSFSNFGTCVDIFAPGSGITSTWSTSNSATNTISGTSMASPHVAGVAALYLDQQPSASPSQIQNAIKSAAVSSRIRNVGPGSPNLLLQSQ